MQTVHPASAAARTAPLAASALLWIGTLIGSVLLVGISRRAQRPTTVPTRVATAAGAAIGATAAVLGLIALWDWRLLDGGRQADSRLVGFLLLAAFAFAAVQGAVLRLAGLAGMAILGPLYLMAPAVAGQVPEVLHPLYRTLLWSWTPFRFSTEGVRSLLLRTTPPDVTTAVWVLAGMAVVGLVVLLWPSRRRGATPPDVDEAAASKPVPAGAPVASGASGASAA